MKKLFKKSITLLMVNNERGNIEKNILLSCKPVYTEGKGKEIEEVKKVY